MNEVDLNRIEQRVRETHEKASDNKQTLTTHMAEDATLSKKGHVQLSNSTTSTSNTLAATSSAVKTAMDRANSAFQQANDAKNILAPAITAKGVPASPTDTFPTLATKIGQISTGKKWASGKKFSNGSHKVEVSGLDFRPSTVIIISTTAAEAPHRWAFSSPILGITDTVIDGGRLPFVSKADGFIIGGPVMIIQEYDWIAYE